MTFPAGSSPPTIAVLDYGIGNLHSAQKAFERVGADARLTADPSVIRGADGVVLPGVGAFGPCMDALDATGLSAIAVEVIEAGVPFMGICVGMQLLYDGSEESTGRAGLGVLAGTVRRLGDTVKRPQMQWNIVHPCEPEHRLFSALGPEPWMYFVHSYAPEATDDVIAVCDYGGSVVAAAARGRVWATQFHPEKSGRAGLRLLQNFVESLGD